MELARLVAASSFSDPFKGLQYSIGRECCTTTNHFCQSCYWYLSPLACKICIPDNTWKSVPKREGKQARELFNQEWEAFEEECRGPKIIVIEDAQ